MNSFHHTWLLCVFQSIWIFFFSTWPIGICLTSLLNSAAGVSWGIHLLRCDVMWCEPFLFVSTSCCMYFSTSLPPIYHPSEGQRGRKSVLKFTGHRGGSGSLLFQSFWNVLPTQTHTHTLTTWCRSAITQLCRLITNHCSAAAAPGCCCGLIKQGEQLKDWSQNDFQIICAFVK